MWTFIHQCNRPVLRRTLENLIGLPVVVHPPRLLFPLAIRHLTLAEVLGSDHYPFEVAFTIPAPVNNLLWSVIHQVSARPAKSILLCSGLRRGLHFRKLYRDVALPPHQR